MYVEKSVDAGLQQKEVRVQWNTPATTKAGLEQEMRILVAEVKSALHMKVDKSYIPPGREGQLVLFENPSTAEYLSTLVYWIFLFLLTQPWFIPQAVTDLVIQAGGSLVVIGNISFGIGLIHIGLALAVLVMGLNSEFPIDPLLKWSGLTLFFGFLTAGRAIKIAYKRKFQLDEHDVIGDKKTS
ncbi:hypothetical protein HDV03_003854 [Kappamyces sp. JEL0829]|nr:hypothetical protein HDV03_003854 [Kappamyces sp. JEL0829]